MVGQIHHDVICGARFGVGIRSCDHFLRHHLSGMDEGIHMVGHRGFQTGEFSQIPVVMMWKILQM